MTPKPTPAPVNLVSEQRNCCDCGAEFTVEFEDDQFSRTIASWKKRCKPCWGKHDLQLQAEAERADEQKREDEWRSVCPALYCDTDIHHPDLSKTFIKAATGWSPNSSRGLGFIGGTGLGKTRCLFVALRRAFDAGFYIRYITHNAFSKLVLLAFAGEGEARKEAMLSLANLGKVGVLLMDDLGKAPATERADAELEEIIETRSANKLPFLWSSNAGGEWLEKRLGADRGAPLVRRLAEFTDIISLHK